MAKTITDKMTMLVNDKSFSSWLRSHPELPSAGADFGFVATDNDFTVHCYKTTIDTPALQRGSTRKSQTLMHLEVKADNQQVSMSQLDTLSKLNLFADRKIVDGVEIRFFGVFVLQMDGKNPDCSRKLRWGVLPKDTWARSEKDITWYPIKHKELIELLRMDRHPNNLTLHPLVRHHKTHEVHREVRTALGFKVKEKIKVHV